MKRILFAFLLILPMVIVQKTMAQEQEQLVENADSIIRQLQSQLQEMQLRDIVLREQLERTGAAQRSDSLRRSRMKARIDSLRNITPGAPLVIDGDTLFTIYARKGGMLAEDRVKGIKKQIVSHGKRLTFFTDSCTIFEGEFYTDIMIGSDVLMSISDEDGLWASCTRQELANEYITIIEQKIQHLHEEYGLQKKLLGLLSIFLIVFAQWLAIKGTMWLFRRWKFRLLRLLLKQAKPLSIKEYELLNVHRVGIIIIIFMRVVLALIIFLQLFISIPMMFSVFPETEAFTYTIFGYIWNPVKSIFSSIIGYIPNLFQIIVIVVCFRYLVKLLRYITSEISNGNLKVNGFYADWAQPTYVIVRLLLYSFMFVMIWPLLPNSNSEVFQGVSVFIGVLISLGSSSIVGNVMAGMVMTYMRPFRIGDFIRYNDIEGFVIEKTVLVTRIRTRKNDVITIPNSNLMSAQTSNYTVAAHDYGIVVHTKVTIGYDQQWQHIRQLLLNAAEATPGLEKKPQPFVLVTTLDDFYVEYEINAYTRHSEKLSAIYSTLHQNILDSFHSSGVEIMSPHIFAHRNDLELQIPPTEKS